MAFCINHPHNGEVYSLSFIFRRRHETLHRRESLHRTETLHRNVFTGFLLFLIFLIFPSSVSAASSVLTYRYLHHLFTITAADMRDWTAAEEMWTFQGREIVPPQELRSEGDAPLIVPAGYERTERVAWDRLAIEATLRRKIADRLNKEPGSVIIDQTATGTIVFEGVGLPGRTVDLSAATLLTVAALEKGVTDIVLPVLETQPALTVRDPGLRSQGILELVTVGESNFTGSTQNRLHNVEVGLNRFNGHIIASGETFSFVKVLGPVDASTGYRKELTIIGARTVPDYGGGLCQVSSTAYRGVWEYGFPIVQRKNHSYAVSYYAPQGTDATVYPPNVDIQFLNDSPGALLIQTYMDRATHKAYFLYYGTRDDRRAQVVGPYVWNRTSPPPPRTEETTDIPAGTQRKVGEAVPGMQTAWFRMMHKGDTTVIDGTYSTYEARPLFWQIGVTTLSTSTGSLSDAPVGETVLSD